MRAMIASLILCLAAACASPGATGERLYTGVYAEGMEIVSFHADGEEGAWAVAGGDGVYALRAAAPPRAQPWDGFHIRATIRGRLSETGRYGHLGLFTREITITDVVAAPAPERQN